MIKNDLFFILYFVFGITRANNSFVVQACKDVENGPKTNTIDLWGREHYKSTIITKAETIQMILGNPEARIGIFSYVRPMAKSFMTSIKTTFEKSKFLHKCFPDVLHEKPTTQADKWSDDEGLVVKRKGFYNESTLEAWGLVEGMPTGKHFTHRVYDDITTLDSVRSPNLMDKVMFAFEMSENLGSDDGTCRIVGTPYHYEDALCRLRALKKPNGKPQFHLRLKPSLEGGNWDGKPVLLSDERIEKLKTTPRQFKTQHLLNPTPDGTATLNPDYLQTIEHNKIPREIQLFLTVDPAGDQATSSGVDSWAIVLSGVMPDRDNLGQSNVYILDAAIAPMTLDTAITTIVNMYMRGGIVQILGIEKAGMSMVELHIVKALEAKGRYLSVEAKNLVLLRPEGRSKALRIESALTWPLNNSKLFISSNISIPLQTEIRLQMSKFPYFRDDFLDAFAYLWDITKKFNFPLQENFDEMMDEIESRLTSDHNENDY